MPYFSIMGIEAVAGKYFCPIHKAWYRPSTSLRCMVIHLPGTCCHVYEEVVSAAHVSEVAHWPSAKVPYRDQTEQCLIEMRTFTWFCRFMGMAV